MLLGVAISLFGLPGIGAAGPSAWRNVEIVGGGFVPGLVFNPSEPDLIYARTDIGGAYRWNPETERWIPLLDFVGYDEANLTGVDTLATDPVDPNRLYVVAGTYTNEWMQENGEVFRSLDRGDSFERIELPFKTGGNMPGRSMGERLAIDPNANRILYMGARSGNGLWRSLDFGDTWERVESFPAVGTYFESPANSITRDLIGVVWVTFDPRSASQGNPSQTIYVGVADKGLSVYRTTDGGTTWQAVPGQPTGFLPHHGVLASQTGMLYVTYSNGAGPFDGTKGDVWRFDTALEAWTRVSPVPSDSDDDYFGYGGLAVDAQQPDTLVVTALNSYFPDTILWRSTDAGESWTQIWDYIAFPDRLLRYEQDITGAPWLTFGELPNPPTPSPKLGFLVGDIEIDPFDSNRMWYVTGATIYGSDDATAWDRGEKIHIEVRAQGLEETAVLDLISPPEGAHLLSALGDIGGFRHEDVDRVPDLMMVNPRFTTGTSIDFAGRRPNVIARVGTGEQGQFGISKDGGRTSIPGGQPSGSSGGGQVAVSADGARILWNPEGVGVHLSSDDGRTWVASSGVPEDAVIASDRVDGLGFYAFSGGSVYRSTDGGASFARTPADGLPAQAKLEALPGRPGDLWLASREQGLWHSTDAGSSFARIEGVEQADTIGFGKPAPGSSDPALFSSARVAGVRGIFQSDDMGASWRRINDDAHQYGFTGQAITGDPRIYGRVYVSTNGRGIILGDSAPRAPEVVQTPSSTAEPAPALRRGPGERRRFRPTFGP